MRSDTNNVSKQFRKDIKNGSMTALSNLYNGLRRCFEGFYIMRSLHALKTIFSNHSTYNNMVSKNINTAEEKNRILINSINTSNNFTIKIRDIEKNKIIPTQTMLDLCSSYTKEGFFTIKNKNANKNGKYPTEFIKFLLNRRDTDKARNIMFGVVQGNLDKENQIPNKIENLEREENETIKLWLKNLNNKKIPTAQINALKKNILKRAKERKEAIILTKKAQVKKAIEYFNFLQS